MSRWPETFRERFDARWTPEPFSGCWLWTGSLDKDGYGRFFLEGKSSTSHRAAWQIYNGSIPNGLHALHSCDTPTCVNPLHLFLGTQADNNHDAVRKGRQARGETNAKAKLTEAKVSEMRTAYAVGGISQSELARRYGVRSCTAHNVLSRKRWTHV